MRGLEGALLGANKARAARKARDAAAPELRPDSHMHCTVCGFEGEPESRTPGSMAIEVVLWLCFLLPGLIYSIWRLNKRHAACAKCGSGLLIPCDSPRAIASRKAMRG